MKPRLQCGGQVFWTTSEEPGFADNKYLNFAVKPDGEWHEYEIQVATHDRVARTGHPWPAPRSDHRRSDAGNR